MIKAEITSSSKLCLLPGTKYELRWRKLQSFWPVENIDLVKGNYLANQWAEMVSYRCIRELDTSFI